MSTQIFVNLPVKDLNKSMAFFRALGYEFNAQFTNDSGACMVVSDSIYVMLLREDFFKGFTPKPVADAKTSTEVLICLSAPSREAVDELVRKAVAAGAKTPNDSKDYGFMYQHGYEDLDGHLWEVMHMDEAAAAQAMAGQQPDGKTG